MWTCQLDQLALNQRMTWTKRAIVSQPVDSATTLSPWTPTALMRNSKVGLRTHTRPCDMSCYQLFPPLLPVRQALMVVFFWPHYCESSTFRVLFDIPRRELPIRSRSRRVHNILPPHYHTDLNIHCRKGGVGQSVPHLLPHIVTCLLLNGSWSITMHQPKTTCSKFDHLSNCTCLNLDHDASAEHTWFRESAASSSTFRREYTISISKQSVRSNTSKFAPAYPLSESLNTTTFGRLRSAGKRTNLIH